MLDQIPPPLAFLADAVTTRRRALGLTRIDLHGAGGPSDSTMSRIENPTVSTAYPRPSTLDRLDTALRWKAGSAAGCLDLRVPTPLEDVAAPAPVEDPPTHNWNPVSVGQRSDPLDFDYVAVPVDVLRDGLMIIQQNLTPADIAGGATALRQLIQFAQKLSAAHATEVLERIGGPGRPMPGFLQITFAPYLLEEVPFDEPSEQQRDDQRYRRWLVGAADDVSGRYERRLDRKLRAIALDAI
ncbi:hypothetical protein [Williamsia sp. CHRR-6]|uniref:hypothetical protein n=1 Tax=Williamsia sp. CHRR-6 TaxID=2835871 RepID=UPI001BDAEE07|nr:hypothetical protein [Williamsia sp. CHRR-6]MBT0568628.1 helix-turn-helix domain-containing protein [Williamsia sp. CHRR-6]